MDKKSSPAAAVRSAEATDDYKKMVYDEWSAPATTAAWGKWHDKMTVQTRAFTQVDGLQLPFAEALFDRGTCRMGMMYFWDCPGALKEILRVLKSGGIAAFAVWGPPEQSPFLAALLEPFMRRKALPEAPPEAPSMLRYARPNKLSETLSAAGFRCVREETRMVAMNWPGPPREMWQNFYELAAPLQAYLDSFAPAAFEAALDEVLEGLNAAWDGTRTSSQSSINIASGLR